MTNIITLNDYGALIEAQKGFYADALLEKSESCASHGLVLSKSQCEELIEKRSVSLRENGRVEAGIGALELLVEKFSASKYIPPYDFAQTLAELLDIFYYMKTEFSDSLTDRELINKMYKSFEGECAGSVEMLMNVERYTKKKRRKADDDNEDDEKSSESLCYDEYSDSDYDYMRE